MLVIEGFIVYDVSKINSFKCEFMNNIFPWRVLKLFFNN